MSFVYDPFDEASAVNLASHVPNTGGAWVNRTWGGNNNAWTVGAGTGVATASALALYTNATAPSAADYYVEIVFARSGFGGIHPMAVLRWQDNSNLYYVGLNEYGSYLQLVKISGGTSTTLATWNWSPSDGDYTVRAEIVGNVIKAYVNGVERINYTDSTSPITPAGLIALFGQGTVKTFDAVLIAPPTITGQPSNQTVDQGQTATFSVTSTDATSFQWQKQEGSSGGFSNISGATSSSYTTGTLTNADDNGDQYRVICTNANGDTTSNVATLTVNPPDTTAPTYAGGAAIAKSAAGPTGCTFTSPVATDNVAVTGYQYNLNSAGWVDIAAGGRVYTTTGRTTGSTDTVEMRAKDAAGNFSAALSVSHTYAAVNDPPTFPGPNISNISATQGQAITPIDVSSKFSDVDTLTYSASPSGTAWPSGLTINSSTGVISGTMGTVATTTGLKVRATDTASQSVDSNAFDITVSAPITYSLVTSPMFNNTGQNQLNGVAVDYSFFPGGVIGALNNITPREGSGTTHASNGTLTVTGLTVSGTGLIFVRDPASGAVFLEIVTAA